MQRGLWQSFPLGRFMGSRPCAEAIPLRNEACPTGKSVRFIRSIFVSSQAVRAKIFFFRFSEKYDLLCAIPARPRGADASSRTLRREAMDVEAVTDEHSRCGRQNRVVPIPRRWDQACKVFGPGRRRWLESPAHRGEHVYAVNQSRREGRVAPVEPVAIFCAFHGCNQHPVFPAPSHWAGWIFHKARTPCAARRKTMFPLFHLVGTNRLHLHLALRQKNCTLLICRAASGV